MSVENRPGRVAHTLPLGPFPAHPREEKMVVRHREAKDPEEFLQQHGYEQLDVPHHTNLRDMAEACLGMATFPVPKKYIKEVDRDLRDAGKPDRYMSGALGFLSGGRLVAFKPEPFIKQAADSKRFIAEMDRKKESLDAAYGEEDAFRIGLPTAAELLYIWRMSDEATLQRLKAHFPFGISGQDAVLVRTGSNESKKVDTQPHLVIPTLHVGRHKGEITMSVQEFKGVFPASMLLIVLPKVQANP